MKKKVLAWMLSVFMVLTMMPLPAFATETAPVSEGTAVAKVGSTEYATIDEAIANWTNGTTLTLLADVTLSDVIKLSSTEHHILDLGTYTMTAASKKDAIQYVVNGRSSMGPALTINANTENPGGITATGKAIVSHTKPSSNAPSKDRPQTIFNGGVFNASYVVKQGDSGTWLPGAGYTGASAPGFIFKGGIFNGTIYTNRSLNQFYGGTFNGSMQMSVDSSAYTQVAGGTFKNLSNSMGSALNSDKFVIGTAKGANNGSVCIDENGYYVVTTTTPASAEASVASSYNSDNYFYYSTVNTNGMYYEDVYDALEANPTGTITVYADELDLADSSFTGTIVVPEGETLTITNAPDNIEDRITILGEGENKGTVNIVKPVEPVAEVNGQGYPTLQDAIDAAGEGDTVTLLSDISLSEGVVIATDDVITLDLNGKVVSRNTEAAVSSAAITNNGNLTIVDSSENQTGKITAVAANPDTADIPYYANNTITNYGVLTVEGGTIENSTGDEARAAFPIDNNSTSRDAIVNIEGGKIIGRGAIRQFANSTTNANKVNITGGTVSGTSYGIWVQNPGDGDPKAELNISGGTVAKVLLSPSANFKPVITGGTIAEVAIWEADTTNADRNPSGFITGGTFGTDVSPFVADGYKITENSGTYGVAEDTGLAGEGTEADPYQIGSAEELVKFRDSINLGEDKYSGKNTYVKLTADIDLADINVSRSTANWAPIGTKAEPFTGIFDGGNNTISNMIVAGETNQGFFGYADNAIIKNLKIENATVTGTDCVGAVAGQVYSVSTIDNCHVSGTINIEGQTNVGGIVGKYYTKVQNCSVIGDGTETSYVKGTYTEADLEGDNVGGIMGHCGENNNLSGNTVKNITISGTRKVGGIVGIADQNTDVTDCTVENVVIETTATADYAASKVTSMSIGGLVGQYQAAGSNNDGTVTGSTVKDVTFVIPDGVVCEAGAITGGARGGSTGMLAPSDAISVEGNSISKVTGATVRFLEEGLAGEGTEANPYLISSAEDLATFRDSVNAGETTYSAPGVYVALGDDIDLSGVEWVPIGSINAEHGFMGNFDGNNHEIQNLKITELEADSDGYVYAGLFGITEGTEVAQQNVIKNLVIKNVNINTGGHIVAAAVAYPYYTTLDNISVIGDIEITGGDYTAGVVSYTRRCTTASDLSISGNEGSFVKGNKTVGGVISDIQMNGGLTANYSNFSASGLTIEGEKSVGGISGIISGQKLDGCSVKDITLNCEDNRVGIVAGSLGAASTIMNVEFENVNGASSIIGANYDGGDAVQAKIGDKYYSTLEAALAAAKAGDEIILLAPYVVGADEEVTLNLKGATITYNSTVQGEAMITNKGELTIDDSVGGGVINYNYTGDADPNYGKGNYTISNGGKLTVNGGKITIANLRAHAKYPIDNNSTSGDAELIINGGHLYNYNTSAIRQFCNSTTNKNSVTIKGGLIEGYCAVWVQNPGSKTVNGDLTITGGEVRSTAAAYVNGTSELKDVSSRIYFTTEGGDWSTDSFVALTGGTFNENVYLAEEAPENIVVDETAATFNGYLELPVQKVAEVNGEKYATLQEAVDAAGDGDTITIVSDIEQTSSVKVNSDKNITIDLNGKTIAGTDNETASFGLININAGAKLIVTDSTEAKEGKITLTATNNREWNAYSSVISNQRGTLVVEAGTIEHLGGTDMAYGIDNLTNGKGTEANTTINGGTVKSTYRAIRQFLNGVEAKNELTVNGGTIEGANKSIWVQDPSMNANSGKITVSEDANLVGDVYLFVTAGSTEWPVEVSIAADALAEGSEVVTGNVPAGYSVELNDGIYGVVEKNASGEVAYRAYINDSADREAVQVDLLNVFAKGSLVIKLLDAEGNVLTTTTLRAGGVDADSYTANIVLSGTPSGSWDTEINAEKLTATNAPETIELYCDGTLVDTYENALGAGTNVNELPKYLALDCVYKEAKIGDAYYTTLQDAIDAAEAGDTVTLLADLTIESDLANAAKGYFNIAEDDKITIDLNGKTIDVTDNSTGNFIVFYSYGDLTIKNGTVKVTSTDDRDWNAQSTIILNRGGNLVVESGTYEHLGGTDMAITVDNSGNSYGDAHLTVKGGEIKSTYTAIRNRMADTTLNGNPGNGEAHITVTGGIIEGGSRGIWGQITDAFAGELGSINVTGGTIEGGNDAIRVTTDGHENVPVTISGDALVKGNLTGEGADFDISGGTFTVAVPAELCAEGYFPCENADGTYGVVEGDFVAEINGKYYDNLQEALDDAETGETVKLVADCEEITYATVVPAGVTLDLNGYYATVKNFLAFGDVVDTNAIAGGIEVSNDTTSAVVQLQPDNTMLPIYDSTNGCYRFFECKVEAAGTKPSEDGTAVTFGFKMHMNEQALELLENDCENSGLDYVVELNWTGLPTALQYKFKASTIKNYITMGTENYAMTLKLTGLDKLPEGGSVTAKPYVESATGVVVNEQNGITLTH